MIFPVLNYLNVRNDTRARGNTGIRSLWSSGVIPILVRLEAPEVVPISRACRHADNILINSDHSTLCSHGNSVTNGDNLSVHSNICVRLELNCQAYNLGRRDLLVDMDLLNLLSKNDFAAIIGSVEVSVHLASNRGVFTVPYLEAGENSIARAPVDFRRFRLAIDFGCDILVISCLCHISQLPTSGDCFRGRQIRCLPEASNSRE